MKEGILESIGNGVAICLVCWPIGAIIGWPNVLGGLIVLAGCILAVLIGWLVLPLAKVEGGDR